MVKSNIGVRLKENYEDPAKTKLLCKMPVIIRIDGKSFHTFTIGMKKPVDEVLQNSMAETALQLCRHIQGCRFAYTQSDEISLLLVDYASFESNAWFDYEVQKLCSVTAALATLYFNQAFAKYTAREMVSCDKEDEETEDLFLTYTRAVTYGAAFDSRCFNMPKEEVTNYFYWRQLSALRNSIRDYGCSFFTHEQMLHKSNEDVKEMMLSEGFDWNELPLKNQRGICVCKEEVGWMIDENIPLFKKEDRAYVDRFVGKKI